MGFQQATVLLIQISISLPLSPPFCSLTTHPQLGEDNKSFAKAMTLKGFVWNASKALLNAVMLQVTILVRDSC